MRRRPAVAATCADQIVKRTAGVDARPVRLLRHKLEPELLAHHPGKEPARRRSEGRRGRAPRRRSKGRQGGPSRRKNKGRRGRPPRCKIKGRRGGTKCRRNPSRQKAGGNGCATGGSQAHQGDRSEAEDTRRVAEANAVRSDDASGSCNADETMISAMCTGSEAAFPAMSNEN